VLPADDVFCAAGEEKEAGRVNGFIHARRSHECRLVLIRWRFCANCGHTIPPAFSGAWLSTKTWAWPKSRLGIDRKATAAVESLAQAVGNKGARLGWVFIAIGRPQAMGTGKIAYPAWRQAANGAGAGSNLGRLARGPAADQGVRPTLAGFSTVPLQSLPRLRREEWIVGQNRSGARRTKSYN
jgi:hypothetical protein